MPCVKISLEDLPFKVIKEKPSHWVKKKSNIDPLQRKESSNHIHGESAAQHNTKVVGFLRGGVQGGVTGEP